MSAPSQHDLSTPPEYKMLAPAPSKVSGCAQFDMMTISHSTTTEPSQYTIPAPSQSTIAAHSRSTILSPPQNLPLPQQVLEELPKKKRGRPRKIRPEGEELEPKERPFKPEQPLFPNLTSIPVAQEPKSKKEQPTKTEPADAQDPNGTIPKKRGRPPKPKATPGGAPLPPYKLSFRDDWFREEWEFPTFYDTKTPPPKVPVIWTRPALPEGMRGPRYGLPVMLTDHRGLLRGGYTWDGRNGQRHTSWEEELDQSNFPSPVRGNAKVYRILDDTLVDEDFCADPPLSRNIDLYQYRRGMPHRLHESQARDASTHFTEDQIAQLRQASERSRAVVREVAQRGLG